MRGPLQTDCSMLNVIVSGRGDIEAMTCKLLLHLKPTLVCSRHSEGVLRP